MKLRSVDFGVYAAVCPPSNRLLGPCVLLAENLKTDGLVEAVFRDEGLREITRIDRYLGTDTYKISFFQDDSGHDVAWGSLFFGPNDRELAIITGPGDSRTPLGFLSRSTPDLLLSAVDNEVDPMALLAPDLSELIDWTVDPTPSLDSTGQAFRVWGTNPDEPQLEFVPCGIELGRSTSEPIFTSATGQEICSLAVSAGGNLVIEMPRLTAILSKQVSDIFVWTGLRERDLFAGIRIRLNSGHNVELFGGNCARAGTLRPVSKGLIELERVSGRKYRFPGGDFVETSG